MSWASIVSKNDKPFEKEIIKEELIEEIVHIEYDHNILDVDDEFDNLYFRKIIEIKIEFKDLINDLALPFLDNNNTFNKSLSELYNFNDFIKENSVNYTKLSIKIDNENNEYLTNLENEEYDEYNEEYKDDYR